MALDEVKFRRYEQAIQRLIRRGRKIELEDLVAIRRAFRSFAAQARSILAGAGAFQSAAVPLLLQRLADDLDRLGRELGLRVRGGLGAKRDLALEMGELLARTYAPGALSTLGVSPQLFNAAIEFTAGLIQSARGGLIARIQAEIDNRLRLAVLGVEGGADAQRAISQALGLGDRWTYEAERIYRTEVNRFHSLASDAQYSRIAELVPLSKRWYWSGISREEHAAIHGQTVDFESYFTVRRRNGETLRLAYPRAIVDANGDAVPGDVTINCGCWHQAIPREAAGTKPLPLRGHEGAENRVRKPTPRARPTLPRPRPRAVPKPAATARRKPATPPPPAAPTYRPLPPGHQYPTLEIARKATRYRVGPASRNSQLSLADWEFVLSLFDALDPAIKRLLDEIDLQSYFLPRSIGIERADLGTRMSARGVFDWTTPARPKVTWAAQEDALKATQTFLHEIGHAVDWGLIQRASPPDLAQFGEALPHLTSRHQWDFYSSRSREWLALHRDPSNWAKFAGTRWWSAYYASTPTESFAQSFALYRMGGSFRASLSPSVRRFIQRHMAAVRRLHASPATGYRRAAQP